MLTELEEIIEYRKFEDRPKKQEMIRKCWSTRLKGCQRNVEVWQRFLKVRSLVIPASQDVSIWIKFANLCRKNNQPILSQKTLMTLLLNDNVSLEQIKSLDLLEADPFVAYVYLKHLWTLGQQKNATLQVLSEIIRKLIVDLDSTLPGYILHDSPLSFPLSMGPPHPKSKLLSRCLLRLSEWKKSVSEEPPQDLIRETIQTYYPTSFLAQV